MKRVWTFHTLTSTVNLKLYSYSSGDLTPEAYLRRFNLVFQQLLVVFHGEYTWRVRTGYTGKIQLN